MLDLLVSGGKVVTPDAIGQFELGIEAEKIVLVGAPGSITQDARRVIDASGKLVVPGGIDPHVHSSWPLMHSGEGGPLFSGGPDAATRAALFGGTTTLIDFAVWRAGLSVRDAVEAFRARWVDSAFCDYSAHLMLLGDPPVEAIEDEIPLAIEAGITSMKVFLTDITPSRRGRKVHLGTVQKLLDVSAVSGVVLAVHAEDDDLVMQSYADHIREGRVEFPLMAEIHSALAEEIAIRRVINVAAETPGSTLYIMHVSSERGVNAVAEAQGKGIRVYAETLHQYALFTDEVYRRPHGQIYHTYPSLKSARDVEALWAGIGDGTISTVGTDGIITSLATKLLGTRVDDVTGGNAGIEPRLAVTYSEAVSRRRMSERLFVDLTSSNAARIFGLYPKKGCLAPGSDADIAILETGPPRLLSARDLHETDYSPWDGTVVTAWPRTTILRGVVVVDDGRLLGRKGQGRFIEERTTHDSAAAHRCV